MFPKKKELELVSLIAIPFGIVLILIVLFFLSIESYFYPNPYIDTQFTENFTWENYNKIEEGMTREEVHNLMGRSFGYGYCDWNTKDIASCSGYTRDEKLPYWDFAWISVNVMYDENDQVIGKSKKILYD